jgi:toxin YhaV
VKLQAAVMEGIKERIAADPHASRFALTGPLRRYGRLKGLGLPDRYRLFFRPFEAEGRRLLLILWLGFPRKDGDRNDCYAVFSRLVQRGELPEDKAQGHEPRADAQGREAAGAGDQRLDA